MQNILKEENTYKKLTSHSTLKYKNKSRKYVSEAIPMTSNLPVGVHSDVGSIWRYRDYILYK